jgi:hypothetical protein
MPQVREQAFGQPPVSRTKRVVRSLTRRVKRRIFLPGESFADGVKGLCGFVLGWGTLIGLLTWGAYRQGFLHGIGDGVTFCAVLFALAVFFAPDYRRSGGPQGRNQY